MKYGKIAIFKNKKITDNHPDFVGKITVTETMEAGEYEVGIYNNESKGGLKYQAGNITEAWQKKKEPEDNNTTTPPVKSFHEPESYDDNDIPF